MVGDVNFHQERQQMIFWQKHKKICAQNLSKKSFPIWRKKWERVLWLVEIETLTFCSKKLIRGKKSLTMKAFPQNHLYKGTIVRSLERKIFDNNEKKSLRKYFSFHQVWSATVRAFKILRLMKILGKRRESPILVKSHSFNITIDARWSHTFWDFKTKNTINFFENWQVPKEKSFCLLLTYTSSTSFLPRISFGGLLKICVLSWIGEKQNWKWNLNRTFREDLSSEKNLFTFDMHKFPSTNQCWWLSKILCVVMDRWKAKLKMKS